MQRNKSTFLFHFRDCYNSYYTKYSILVFLFDKIVIISDVKDVIVK